MIVHEIFSSISRIMGYIFIYIPSVFKFVVILKHLLKTDNVLYKKKTQLFLHISHKYTYTEQIKLKS